MPNKLTEQEKEAFRQRLLKGMTAHGYDVPGGIKEFAERYANGKSPMVSQWRIGRYMPGPSKLQQIAHDWKCSYEWLRFGNGAPPKWAEGSAVVAFTPERRADDNVVAVHIALESLAVALLQKTPGASTVFLADLVAICRERKVSPDHGLLGRLSNIAETIQSDEAKFVRGKRRADPGRRTKP
jgi:hypothetical protein